MKKVKSQPSKEERKLLALNTASFKFPENDVFTASDWKKIVKALKDVKPHFLMEHICEEIVLIIEKYRAAIIIENAEAITGFDYRSSENRRRLNRAIKVFEGIKEIILQGRPIGKTEKKWVKEAFDLLNYAPLRLLMLEKQKAKQKRCNGHCFKKWPLKPKNTSINHKTILDITELVLTICKEQRALASMAGNAEKIARKSVFDALAALWERTTCKKATAPTNRITNKIEGGFVVFVCAVLVPLSERLPAEFSSKGLKRAIKEWCTQRKKVRV